MEIEHLEPDPRDMDDRYLLRVSHQDSAHFGKLIINEVTQIVAKELAARFLETHGTDILAAMSPEAIATMAVAEAGAAVHETLQRKLPDRVLEVERRVESAPIVLQRGIFGGVRRIG